MVSLKVLSLLPILPSRYQYWPKSPPPLTCAIAKITPLHRSIPAETGQHNSMYSMLEVIGNALCQAASIKALNFFVDLAGVLSDERLRLFSLWRNIEALHRGLPEG